MAGPATTHDARYLRAIVDMGSNGIRFSISSLQPPTARIMPTLYQSRAGISLYEAQYSANGDRQPIDEKTIAAVIAEFKQFKRTCADFGVPAGHVSVLATEATRTASNSEAFRKQIKDAVGWQVTMMPKEEEGRVGAMGIASSLPEVTGLVMDLGGGSTQLSWLVSKDGSVTMPESGAVSMPYGAAAMSRRLADAERSGTTNQLKAEVQKAVKEAYANLRVPKELEENAHDQGGFTLYLSGGGFRGWGYLLMSQHRIQPYPVPVINGFKASREEFMGTDVVKMAAAATLKEGEEEIFRVSNRRASQVPAVAFLINELGETLPQIKEVRFCQGGVREGYLYSALDREVQAQHPLVMATRPFCPSSLNGIVTLLSNAFPPRSTQAAQLDYKGIFNWDLLEAFANTMYYHASHSKDLQASSALRSTTSGILAGVHGLLHEDRTLLALLLCARWGGDIPPTDEGFKSSLEQLVQPPLILWWTRYLGAVGALIAAIYPAAVTSESRLALKAKWDLDEKGHAVLMLEVRLAADYWNACAKEIKNIEKLGKKKNWIGGKDGIAYRVTVKRENLHT